MMYCMEAGNYTPDIVRMEESYHMVVLYILDCGGSPVGSGRNC
jgi:hypothetical protein